MEYIDQVLLELSKPHHKKEKIELSNNIKIRKVAYDLYRIVDAPFNPYDTLWELSEENGKKFLIRASEPVIENEKIGDWSAESAYNKKSVTLIYKDVPIHRFSSEEYSFSPETIGLFKSAILDSVNSGDIVKDILNEQPQEKVLALLSSYPELKKYLGEK